MYHPETPIVAVTPDKGTFRRLALIWRCPADAPAGDQEHRRDGCSIDTVCGVCRVREHEGPGGANRRRAHLLCRDYRSDQDSCSGG